MVRNLEEGEMKMSNQKHKTSINLSKQNMGLIYFLIKEGKQVSMGDYLDTILDGMTVIYAEEYGISTEEFIDKCMEAYELRNRDMTDTPHRTFQNLKKMKSSTNAQKHQRNQEGARKSQRAIVEGDTYLDNWLTTQATKIMNGERNFEEGIEELHENASKNNFYIDVDNFRLEDLLDQEIVRLQSLEYTKPKKHVDEENIVAGTLEKNFM